MLIKMMIIKSKHLHIVKNNLFKAFFVYLFNMDKFNIYLFIMNFWQYIFNNDFLDISKIKIVLDDKEEIETQEQELIYSDSEL